MEADSLQARIEHSLAELRGACPRITACHAWLDDWTEGPEQRYALRLDIRWPQHQSLLSGPACAGATQAVQAGFEKALRRASCSA